MDKAVVLLSGGMDSATLLYYLRKKMGISDIHALTFAYGQKHARELDMARWLAKEVGVTAHVVLDISFFGQLAADGSALTNAAIPVPDLASLAPDVKMQPPTYVPNRNMTFLSIAAAYAESRKIQDIFYGAQAQDEYGYWDCSLDFVRRINEVMNLNRRNPVKVQAPFAGMSKSEVARIGQELGVDFSRTWTCYRGGAEPCGTCPSCVERVRALESLRADRKQD
jgi:7-cyano-7-deazaguanine synthase